MADCSLKRAPLKLASAFLVGLGTKILKFNHTDRL
eukprot:SAG11_NODE_11808_length_737_cov_1.133229_1_plen_34_part_10